MTKFFSLNFVIPNYDSDYVPFESNNLLSDADIIIIRPPYNNVQFNYNSHWYEEIVHVLELGKTVVVLLAHNHDSGSTYDFLPSLPIDVISAKGIEVFPKLQIVEPLFSGLKEYWTVQSYLKINEESTPIFSSKNNDRVLGSITKWQEGHIIFLPYLDFFGRNLQHPNSTWNELAQNIGNSFKNNIITIHNILNDKIELSPKPDWLESPQFNIEESIRLLSLVENNLKTIEELNVENNNILQIVEEKELLKNLLFETGKILEDAVIKALEILGYSAENYDDGILELDQVIISPEGDRFIGECEGKDNKAIDITKFRQLQDSLNEDFQREEVEEKAFGLLFGNPQRLINPEDREFDFTDKCKRGAQREKIGLINTADLFDVARYLSENQDEPFKIVCRNIIKENLGQIIKFPPIPIVE